MFKVQSLALTAALFGLTSAQTGCYPAYNSGSYGVDDYVSATRTVVENEGQFEQCTPNVSGCPASGQRSIETTTVTTYNFKCLVAAWCSQPAYDPVGVYFNSNGAWENLGVCSVSLILLLRWCREGGRRWQQPRPSHSPAISFFLSLAHPAFSKPHPHF